MLNAITEALDWIGQRTEARMPSHHLSNHAVNQVMADDDYILLADSYEDGNVDGIRDAQEAADFLEALAPGKFVLIDTGDYIYAPYVEGHDLDLDTYDPQYRLLLTTREIVDELRAELELVDQKWRAEALARAYSDVAQVVAS